MTLVPSPTKVIVFFDLSGQGNATGPFYVLLEDGDQFLTEDADLLAEENNVGTATGFLTLDDPIKGQLDDADWVLAGDLAQDISEYTSGVTVTRGRRSPIFTDIPAGRWTITLNNLDRTFDPYHTSSPFFGNIVPGKRCRIVTNNVTIADGFIEDWNLFYAPNGRSTAQIVCTDPLAALAAVQLDTWTTTSQAAGARINAILDRPEVNWGLNRDIDTGVTTLQADTVLEGTSALVYAGQVTRSEFGRFFATRDGVVKFTDRDANLSTLSGVILTDDGTGIPYQALDVIYGTEQLYNEIRFTRVGGTQQTVSDADSIEAFRARTLTRTDLLHSTDQQVDDLANYLLNIYATPVLRIDRVDIELAGLTDQQRASLLQLDISDTVEVIFTPNGIGDPINQWCSIEGIDHRINPDRHTITLHLGSTVTAGTFLTLDDPVLGRLDFNVVGF